MVQMVSSAQIEENLMFVEHMAKSAHTQEVSLLVLPENFACMGTNHDTHRIAESFGDGVIQNKISALAKEYQLWIVAGTLPIKTGGSRVRARSIVFDAQGCAAAYYDKIHLFDVRVSDTEAHQESHAIEAGSEVVVVDTPVGCLGLSVCYDVRFAELYHKLVAKGAELFTIPSAFTSVTGQAHWNSLLRTRAIENLSFVLAAAQGGMHENGRQTHGHSMVIEPWGAIIAEQETGVGLLTAPIDRQRVHQLRKQFPCIEHHVLN